MYLCTGIFHSFSTAVLHGNEVIGSVLSGSPESQAYYHCYLIHRVFTRALRAKAAQYGPSDLWSVLDSFVTQQIAIISDFSPGLFWAEVIILNVMRRDEVTGSAAVGLRPVTFLIEPIRRVWPLVTVRTSRRRFKDYGSPPTTKIGFVCRAFLLWPTLNARRFSFCF